MTDKEMKRLRARINAERNARVTARYDELMRGGKHGHYETLFRVVREEVERVLAPDLEDLRYAVSSAIATLESAFDRTAPKPDPEGDIWF